MNLVDDIPAITGSNGSADAKKIKVLMYHRVFNPKHGIPADREFSVPANVFRSQLRMMEKLGFTTITFEDYDLHLRGLLNLPKKPIILTFDDGYQDNYEVALPLLLEYGMKAVLFVIADEKIRTNRWDDGDDSSRAPLMTREQIIEMHSAGMEIGSHSLSHPHLSTLTRDQAWEEIFRSRVLLEILLNTPVRTFAYPYGDLNTEMRHLVIEAGYRFACGVFTGPPSISRDHFDIRRINPTILFDPLGFCFQLITPYEYFLWFGRNVMRFVKRFGKAPKTISPEVKTS